MGKQITSATRRTSAPKALLSIINALTVVLVSTLFLVAPLGAQETKRGGTPLDFNTIYPRGQAPTAMKPLPHDVEAVHFAGNGFVPVDWQMYKDPYLGFGGGEVANFLEDATPYFKTIYADQPLHLPVGAKILRVSGMVMDNHPTWDAIVAVNSTDLRGADFKSCFAYSAGVSDWNYFEIAAACDITIQRDRIYTARIVIPPGGSFLRVSSLSVSFAQTFAPSPSVATFSDVPSSDPFFPSIEAFAKSGLTAGCGGGNFCPDAVVTRRQLAAFLTKALGLGW